MVMASEPRGQRTNVFAVEIQVVILVVEELTVVGVARVAHNIFSQHQDDLTALCQDMETRARRLYLSGIPRRFTLLYTDTAFARWR